MNPTIFIAGDVVPMRRTAPLFQERQADVLFGAMREHICSSDLSIVNLEAPIAEKAMSRIRKSGPSLCCASSTLETLKEAGFNTITLANNHFRDYGEYGVHMRTRYIRGAYRRGWLGRVFSTPHVYEIKNKLVCQSHYDVASQLFKLLTLDN